MDERQLDQLIEAHYAGNCSEEDARELASILEASADARQRFVQAALEEEILSAALGRRTEEIPMPKPAPWWRPSLAIPAAAAAVLLVSALVFAFRTPPTPIDPGETLARVVKGSAQTREGESTHRLVAGRYQLAEATELRFGEAVLYAKREGEIDVIGTGEEGRTQLALGQGRFEFDVPAGARGFELSTEVGILRDIGTRFVLDSRSAPGGRSMLANSSAAKAALVTLMVLSGMVDFAPSAGASDTDSLVIAPGWGEMELQQDGGIGSIVDVEGLARLRPANRRRWSPARAGGRLQPGDWIKTGGRGANALHLRLANGSEIILGPGAQLLLRDPSRIELQRGEIALQPNAGQAIVVTGPGGAERRCGAPLVLRAGQSLELSETPAWLTAYRSDQSGEAMGSLVAMVDGRELPLRMGTHAVSIDIRDQIARTVIQETFINQTTEVLEGTFYFPLPAGASISGFAMWIDGEKVHGEIVEKQRAREIYETILREKRDPGLLEWTSGNLFKARVYPIVGEKRIEISYTQALEKTNGAYRYRYGLRSDMLRKTPLDQLDIGARISSSRRIRSLSSPSLACRIETAEMGGSVEFSAENFRPDRDFELVIEEEAGGESIQMINHRRGDDGYFMLLVDAPVEEETQRPEILREGDPLSLIILVDRSGSMNGLPSDLQRRFVEALFASLSPTDRFALATLDGQPRWAFNGMRSGTEAQRDALAQLDRGIALGWTDIEASMRAALERAEAGTQILYLGDGVQSQGELGAAALSARLGALPRFGQFPIHAIGLGNVDSLALRSLATKSSGSLRMLEEKTEAASTAAELVRELTAPVLRDLSVEIVGAEVAALHPTPIPNVPAGRQTILLGRYDALVASGEAELIVRGRFGDRPFEQRQKVRFVEDGGGNSFVPRLWARRRLDHLLAQGSGPDIVGKVIGLSEDFQIITPYTSFLVLESEADRRRFKVEKRFRMRDGEEFFAEGRQAVTDALEKEQLKAIRLWRAQLRDRLRRQVADLGRSLTTAPAPQSIELYKSAGLSGNTALPWRETRRTYFADEARSLDVSGEWRDQLVEPMSGAFDGLQRFEANGRLFDDDASLKLGDFQAPNQVLHSFEKRLERQGRFQYGLEIDGKASKRGFLSQGLALRGYGSRFANLNESFSRWTPQSQLAQLFPQLGARPFPREASVLRSDVEALIAGLKRRAVIAGSEVGFRFRISSGDADDLESSSLVYRSELLASPTSFFGLSGHRRGHGPLVDWCDGERRGQLNRQWSFGRERSSQAGDADAWSAPFSFYFDGISLDGDVRHVIFTTEAGITNLLVHATNGRASTTYVFEDKRQLLLAVHYAQEGRRTQSRHFKDFVKVGGQFWPRRIEFRNADRKLTSWTAIQVETLSLDTARAEVTQRRSRALEGAMMLPVDLPSVAEARAKDREGKLGLAEAWTLTLHAAGSLQKDRLEEALKRLRPMIADRAGSSRLELAALRDLGREEEARQALAALIGGLRDSDESLRLGRAYDLNDNTRGFLSGEEALSLILAIRTAIQDIAAQEDRKPVLLQRAGHPGGHLATALRRTP